MLGPNPLNPEYTSYLVTQSLRSTCTRPASRSVGQSRCSWLVGARLLLPCTSWSCSSTSWWTSCLGWSSSVHIWCVQHNTQIINPVYACICMVADLKCLPCWQAPQQLPQQAWAIFLQTILACTWHVLCSKSKLTCMWCYLYPYSGFVCLWSSLISRVQVHYAD